MNYSCFLKEFLKKINVKLLKKWRRYFVLTVSFVSGITDRNIQINLTRNKFDLIESNIQYKNYIN